LKIVSINAGKPRTVEWKGKSVTTGIYKEPVEGPVMMRTLNLDGDKQADLKVHGGVSKAVYAYPVEHYAFWRERLPDMELPYGMFGENFTTEGLLEDDMHVGDVYRVGEGEVRVTEPRMPCYKLGIKFGRSDILKMFLASMRTGFYFAVVKRGMVKAGDTFELMHRDENQLAITEITRLYAYERDNVELLKKAAGTPTLSDSWRDYFIAMLYNLETG